MKYLKAALLPEQLKRRIATNSRQGRKLAGREAREPGGANRIEGPQGFWFLGAWETGDGGTQVGAKGSATLFGLDGSLGDIAELFGAGPSPEEGGWQNFFNFHADGPSAWAEGHAGSSEARVGAQASALSGGMSVGGAEYDWFGGTEIWGTAAAAGVGGSAGLKWTDDDGDGITEWGGQIGGAWGIGGNIGFKTEIPGHLMNAASDAVDWLMSD